MTDLLSVLNLFISNLSLLVLLGSVLMVLVGKILYGINIFQPLEEIAYKQETYRRENKLRQFNEKLIKYYLELGEFLLDTNRLEAAKSEFGKVLKLDPSNIEAHMGIVKSEIFEPVLKNDPYYYDRELVEKKLNMLLKNCHNDKHVFRYLGRFYSNIDKKSALKYCEKALSVGSVSNVSYMIYSDLATLYAMSNNNEMALFMMEKAGERTKWNPRILNNLGYQYLMQENYSKAIEYLEPLIESYPHYLLAYWNIMNAFRMNGDFDSAYSYNKKLILCIEKCSEDKHLSNLFDNHRPWFFNTQTDKVAYFNDFVGKKCYIYCSMALTCYIDKRKNESDEFIDKAKKLENCDITPTKDLLYFYIELIKKNNNELTQKLEEFKDKLEASFDLITA